VKQSPISIQTNEAIVDVNRLKPIVLKNYGSVPNNNYTIENNGHTGTLIVVTGFFI
jgi:hypothetical protein